MEELDRICTKCEKALPPSSFYRRPNGTLRAECKRCFLERSQRYRQTESGQASMKAAMRRRKADPAKREQLLAWNCISKLIYRGKMPPASSLQCVSCNGPADHYHHHRGYDKKHREDVVPICRTCHAKEHYPTA